MKDIILNIEGVTKYFSHKIKVKNGQEDIEHHTILDNLNLSIEKGKITALIGGNGTGKTTLFNVISGLIPINQGKIHYFNGNQTELIRMSPYKISRLGIGRLFQDAHIFPELSIIDNMIMSDSNRMGELPFSSIFLYLKVIKNERSKLEKAENILYTLFDGDELLINRFIFHKNDLAKSLSYGQQRLLGLARLLMADNKLILLDEPTSGVNQVINNRIAQILFKIVKERGTTIFLIEHNMSFIAEVSDICAFLNKGKIEFLASPSELLNNELVQKSYLGI
jgi:ABC-type branched-subunit amino acid transport system ATPase component